MSVLYLASKKQGKELSAEEIEAIYHSAVMTGIIGKEEYKNGALVDGCFVNDPVALFQLAGIRVSSVVKMDFTYKAQRDEYEILCFHRPADTPQGYGNVAHTHFITEFYDPMGQSQTVKYGKLKSKRIFK